MQRKCMRRRSRVITAIPILLILALCNCSPDKPTPDPALSYDLHSHQTPVRSHRAVDSILAELELIPFQKLDKEW